MVVLFLLEGKISTFVFELELAMQTIVAHETEKLENNRRSFEDVIHTPRKESRAYRARLTKPAVTRKVIHANLRPDHYNDDHVFMIYGKRRNYAYHGPQTQVMPPPRIPGPIRDYCCNRSGQVDQPMQHKRHPSSQNIVCHQCFAHGH